MKDEKNQGKSKDSLTPFFRALALSLSLFLFLPLLEEKRLRLSKDKVK